MSYVLYCLASYFFGKYSRVWIVVLGTVGLPLKDPFDLSQISRQINHLHEWQWSWHAYCIDSITQICWIKSTKSSRLYTSQLDNFDQCCSHRNALFNIIPLMRTGCREASYHKGWMRIPLIIMPIPQGGRLSGAPLWALTISRRKNYFSDWKEEWIMLGTKHPKTLKTRRYILADWTIQPTIIAHWIISLCHYLPSLGYALQTIFRHIE